MQIFVCFFSSFFFHIWFEFIFSDIKSCFWSYVELHVVCVRAVYVVVLFFLHSLTMLLSSPNHLYRKIRSFSCLPKLGFAVDFSFSTNSISKCSFIVILSWPFTFSLSLALWLYNVINQFCIASLPLALFLWFFWVHERCCCLSFFHKDYVLCCFSGS